jgi:hypothetical protein
MDLTLGDELNKVTREGGGIGTCHSDYSSSDTDCRQSHSSVQVQAIELRIRNVQKGLKVTCVQNFRGKTPPRFDLCPFDILRPAQPPF